MEKENDVLTQLIGKDFIIESVNVDEETETTHKAQMWGHGRGWKWHLKNLKEDWPMFRGMDTLDKVQVDAGQWIFYASENYLDQMAELGPGETLPGNFRSRMKSFKRVL